MKKHWIIIVLLAGILYSCENKDIIQPTITEPTLYFNAVVDGTPTRLEAGAKGYEMNFTRDDNISGRFWGTHMIPDTFGKPTISIVIANHTFPPQNPQDDFEKSILVKQYEFGNALIPGPDTGVVFITYSDENNLYESSIIDQGIEKFKMTSVSDTTFAGLVFKVVQMEFNAKLRSPFNGDSINITTARARMAFANPN